MSIAEVDTQPVIDAAEPPAHRLEQRVYRELCRCGGVAYSAVVVRRLPNGVCLEGVVRGDSGSFDPSRSALSVPGVREVLNHLVHCDSASGTYTR